MLHTAKSRFVWLLVLLAVHQAGCLAESDSVEVAGKCGPRDLSPECCLKQNPGQWERCTGSSEMVEEVTRRSPSPGMKAAAAATAGALVAALNPQINSAERQGVELAANLLAKVEKAIARCARQADQEVNDYHFKGKSPSRELCQQLKIGEQTTWAAYLGIFKHEQAWPCLRKALDELLPGRYRLHPRFRLDERTGTWEFLDEEVVKRLVSEQGWKSLAGTIEPDIILMDAEGFIIRVYDLKFPCPETNVAQWEKYKGGRWRDELQGDVYERALQVPPQLVSPKRGVESTR